MAENHQRGSSRPALVLLLLIVIGFYWRITLTDQYTWLDSPDLASQVLPWFQFQVSELWAGRAPLWDPHLFGGQPLAGQGQPGLYYPLNWLLYLIPPNENGWIRHGGLIAYFVAIHYLAACFAWKLCRDLNLGQAASVLGGCVFSLGGFMASLDWPQMLNGACWGPLVLMFLLRAFRSQRAWASAASGGLCLGISFLSGHHQVPIYLGLMGVIFWIVMVCTSARHRRVRLLQAAMFFLVAGLIAWLLLSPLLEYSKLSYRWVGLPEPVRHEQKVPYAVLGQYSLKPDLLLGLIISEIHGVTSLYAGATAALLAFLGLALGWRRAEARVAFCVSLGGLAFSLGSANWLHGLLYSLVPMLDKARSPAMAASVFHLGWSLLAAFGFDQLPRHWRSPWIRRAFHGAIIFGLLVFGAQYLDVEGRKAAGAVNALAVLLAVAAMAAWRRQSLSQSAAAAAILSCVLFELGVGKPGYWPSRDRQEFIRRSADPQLWQALENRDPMARVEMSTADFEFNIGDLGGLEMWHGYLASLPANIHEMQAWESQTLEAFGVRYRVSRRPQGKWSKPTADIGGGLFLWENSSALPRLWTVHRLERAGSRAEIRARFHEGDFDPRVSAMAGKSAPELDSCSLGDSVFLLRRTSNLIRTWVEMECRGMVVLSETYYPGWQAEVDGRPAEIHEVNGAMRGVVVEPGRHMLEMAYRPRTVRLGVLAAFLGLIVWLAAQRIDRRTKL